MIEIDRLTQSIVGSIVRFNDDVELLTGGYWLGDQGIEQALAFYCAEQIRKFLEQKISLTLEERTNGHYSDIVIWNKVYEDLFACIEIKRLNYDGNILKPLFGDLERVAKIARSEIVKTRRSGNVVNSGRTGFVACYFQGRDVKYSKHPQDVVDALTNKSVELGVVLTSSHWKRVESLWEKKKWHYGAICVAVQAVKN